MRSAMWLMRDCGASPRSTLKASTPSVLIPSAVSALAMSIGGGRASIVAATIEGQEPHMLLLWPACAREIHYRG